jgi:hypothetical protein
MRISNFLTATATATATAKVGDVEVDCYKDNEIVNIPSIIIEENDDKYLSGYLDEYLEENNRKRKADELIQNRKIIKHTAKTNTPEHTNQFMSYLVSKGQEINVGMKTVYTVGNIYTTYQKTPRFNNMQNYNTNYNTNYITNCIYMPYNLIEKVKCTMYRTEFVINMDEYIEKVNYYKKLFIKEGYHSICARAFNVMPLENIIKVITIYLDMPYFITIKITTIFIGNKYEDIFDIYRHYKNTFFDVSDILNPESNTQNTNTTSLTTSEIKHKLENVLFNVKNRYKTEKQLDYYNSLLFLHNIIRKKTQGNTEKKQLIIDLLNDSNIHISQFTNKLITITFYNHINRIITNILDIIQIRD